MKVEFDTDKIKFAPYCDSYEFIMGKYYLGIDIPTKDDPEWRFWVLIEDAYTALDIPVEDKEHIKNKVIEYCLSHEYSYNGKYFDKH